MQHRKREIKIHKALNTFEITDHGTVYNSWTLFLPKCTIIEWMCCFSTCSFKEQDLFVPNFTRKIILFSKPNLLDFWIYWHNSCKYKHVNFIFNKWYKVSCTNIFTSFYLLTEKQPNKFSCFSFWTYSPNIIYGYILFHWVRMQ